MQLVVRQACDSALVDASAIVLTIARNRIGLVTSFCVNVLLERSELGRARPISK